MADIRFDFGFDDLDKLQAILKELQKSAKDIQKSMQTTGKTVSSDVEGLKKYATATKTISNEKKKLTTIEKEELRIKNRLETVNAKIKLSNTTEAQLLRQKEKQLRAINTQLRTGGANTNTWTKALGSFQFKFNALGNIASSVTSLISRSFNKAIRDAVKIIVDFDQAMADVKAITKATTKEFEQLRESAKALGGTTKFTATQVALLQKEYGKLGFSTKEILKAQAATLDLASATGSDLARSAEVAGSTVRGFRLNASETQRVVDVMADSFTSSALDIERFAESMKYAAPIAAEAGVSIEEVTAMLSVLADAGIHGSMAGTALRNIFSQLVGEGGNLQTKLKNLAKEGLTLAGAEDEVGKRAQTALLVLMNQIREIPKLTEQYNNAAGAAQQMADVQLDTLQGKVTILKSAWQGLILEMSDSKDNFDGIKGAINLLTASMNSLANAAANESLLAFGNTVFGGIQRRELRWMERQIIKVTEEIVNMEQPTINLGETIKGVWDNIKNLPRNIWNEIVPTDEAIVNTKELPKVLKILTDEQRKFTDEEQGWYDEILRSIGVIFPMTKDELDILADVYDEMNASISESTIKSKEETDAAILESTIKRTEEEIEAEEKLKKKRQDAVIASFDSASNIVSRYGSLVEAQKQKELSTVGDNAAKRLEIEKKYAKKQQGIAISESLINVAGGITKTFYEWGFPLGIPFAAALAAAGALEIATIKSQKFAKGGMINGEPHSRGGVNIEAEGGEYVINKRSTSKYKDLVEAINRDDQIRIIDAMSRDRKISLNNIGDPYNRKIYELMRSQERYGEDKEHYIIHKGNHIMKIKK